MLTLQCIHLLSQAAYQFFDFEIAAATHKDFMLLYSTFFSLIVPNTIVKWSEFEALKKKETKYV